jgi:hypothetical protein
VWNLQEKSFHGKMLILVEVFVLSMISSCVLWVVYLYQNPGWPNSPNSAMLSVSNQLNWIGWLCNNIAHVYFVLKIWIVSKKIDLAVSKQTDPHIVCKERSMATFLILFCAVPYVLLQLKKF